MMMARIKQYVLQPHIVKIIVQYNTARVVPSHYFCALSSTASLEYFYSFGVVSTDRTGCGLWLTGAPRTRESPVEVVLW